MISQYNEFVENQQKALSYQGHLITVSVHNVSGFNDQMGGSRKFPYPYHGRHLGIPKGGGLHRLLEFRGHGGVHWTGILKAWGDFQDSNFQFGVVKFLQEKLVKNDLSKDDHSLVNMRHVQLNQHAGDTFQWSWSIKCLC